MASGTAKEIPPPARGVTPARLSRPLPRNFGASFVTMGRRKLRSPWTRSLLKESTNDLSARQQRRGVEMTMRQLYNENAFLARVNFAEKCFRDHQTHTRAMDTCFGMYDGAAVVVALVRRCRARPPLSRSSAVLVSTAPYMPPSPAIGATDSRRNGSTSKRNIRISRPSGLPILPA